VVERVHPRQPLVEVVLGFGVIRRDGAVMRTHPAEEPALRVVAHGSRARRARRAAAGENEKTDSEGGGEASCGHGDPPDRGRGRRRRRCTLLERRIPQEAAANSGTDLPWRPDPVCWP
jgi:hypothetical protein